MTNVSTKRLRMEALIERIVDLEYDQLNHQLRSKQIDQDQYQEEARAIDQWARATYEDLDMRDVR